MKTSSPKIIVVIVVAVQLLACKDESNDNSDSPVQNFICDYPDELKCVHSRFTDSDDTGQLPTDCPVGGVLVRSCSEQDLIGKCTTKKSDGTDVVYYYNGTDKPALLETACRDAGGEWTE